MREAGPGVVCRDCPEYATNLAVHHPLDNWAMPGDDDVWEAMWWSAAGDVLGCLMGEEGEELGERAEEVWNDMELVFEDDADGDAARHGAALEKCASSTYWLCAPRPTRAVRHLEGELDRLPTSRLDVAMLADSLRQRDAELLRFAVAEPALSTTTKKQAMPCHSLTEADLQSLLESGVAEPCAGRPHITLPVFTIAKPNGKKRLLVDGREFDARSCKMPAPRLPHLEAFEAFVLAYERFSVIDFLGYFLQIPIEESLRNCLGFRMPPLGPGVRGRYFRFKVAVPGTARAPLTAQLCTLGVRRRAGVSDHSLAVYDDIGLGGRDCEELRVREERLRRAARETGITIRAEKGFSGQSEGVLCGLLLDLGGKTVALPTQWVEDVAVRNRAPARLTCRAASHHIGCFLWAHRVMRVPMGLRPYTMRLARALGRACDTAAEWDRVLRLPAECVAEFAAAENWMRTCPPRRVSEPAGEWHLWTDASDEGGAVVLLDPSARRVRFRRSWRWDAVMCPLGKRTAPIRRRELAAALLGCLVAAELAPSGCTLRVFHDNATAESRHRKGSSPHLGECRLLVLAHGRLSAASVVMQTVLVPSGHMVADRDTRSRVQ